MSSLRSRVKGLIRRSKPSSQTTEDATTPADTHRNTPPTSRINTREDRLGFVELAPGTDPVVDIVAIHGLDGHRESTWTAENGTLWLRDLLSVDVPKARILAYGYDADTRSHQCLSTQTIYQHADKFVKSLERERVDAQRRPIIFIAHSLGGIVLKQALILCHNQNLGSTSRFRDILVSTHGVLFFGTPHSGVKGADLLQTMNRLLSVYMKTTDVILRSLGENSPELENIQNLYTLANEGIQTVTFYEVYPTPTIGGRQQIIVPHHSATIAGDRHAIQEGLQADHCQMVKFPNKEHKDYKAVLSYITRQLRGAATAVEERWSLEDGRRAVGKGDRVPLPEVMPKPKPCPPVSRSYVNRTQIQVLITQNLLPTGPVKHQPRCVLHGLGGAGKTQLAANWIQENERSFTRVIFIDASSQALVEADLERSVRCLGPEYGKMTWKDAVAYLDGKEKGWLLFFDNADSPDLDLRPYFPRSQHGAILITTRNRECVDYARDGAVPVADLEESEAVQLLHTTANVVPESDTKSVEIVRELGMLALAITQAGAYIHKTRRLDSYLETFRSHRNRLLRTRPDRSTEYTLSTYTAFDLSFQQLPAKTQKLLRLLAFLYHSLIPLALFERATSSGFVARTVWNSCPPGESDKAFISKLVKILGMEWDEISFQDIIDSASRASLIHVSADGLYYSIHPLFQTYIKDGFDKEKSGRYTRMAAQLLLGAIRPSEGGNGLYWHLLPHVDAVPRSVQSENVAHILAFDEFYNRLGDWKACRELLECGLMQLLAIQGQRHEDSIWLMGKLGIVLRSCGLLAEAEKMEREVLALRLDILGKRHPDTISAMAQLANTLEDLGELDEAEKTQREVLALQLDILGKRHPNTLSAMSNLAVILCHRRHLDEAEKMNREVIALQLEIRGKQHPDTLSAMDNLAIILGHRGQLDKAEKMKRELLALRLEILGERHPDTISAMNNLAVTLFDRGQLGEAEKMNREVLAVRLEILGERHPHTISAMENLALTLCIRGQLGEAERIQREVLALRLDILGERHPDMVKAMANLAATLAHCGRLDEVERMWREVLGLRTEILGERHPETILAMNNLAVTLGDRGCLDDAEKVQQEVLALRQEILGEKHPETILAMFNLAVILCNRGQLGEAEKMNREVLALQLELLGERHLDTIKTMNNLASILCDCGQLDKAEEIQRKVLALRQEILEERHPDTVLAMNNLAVTLGNRGRLEEAERMKRDVLALQLEILGERHPSTISAMANLASTLYDRGQSDEAEKMEREVLALRLDILGPRHFKTLDASYNLVVTLVNSGRFEEAVGLLRETNPLRIEVLGDDHPVTRRSVALLSLLMSKISS